MLSDTQLDSFVTESVEATLASAKQLLSDNPLLTDDLDADYTDAVNDAVRGVTDIARAFAYILSNSDKESINLSRSITESVWRLEELSDTASISDKMNLTGELLGQIAVSMDLIGI